MIRRIFNAFARWAIETIRWRGALSLDNHIRLAYRLVLGRAADPEGLAYYRRHIAEQNLPPAFVFEALANSVEYRKSPNPLHYARTQLIRRLPRADAIVDLGGSSKHTDDGALYAMGYAPRAKRLIIVDLPPRERYEEWRKETGERKRVETGEGLIEYVYGSIADPAVIPESGFADLVWSGNSIEHISEEEADGMLDMAFRILKPGGRFCLDTPNRRVTKALYPDAWCNPDHKIEYTHDALSSKLRGHGFEIVERFGVLDCRAVLEGAPFNHDTQMAAAEFTGAIEDGFLLYYHCRKPQNARE